VGRSQAPSRQEHTTADVSTREQTKHNLPVRTLVAASVGNAVEWYDWTVFATFSIYFATQIFSAQNMAPALIGIFATYAVAFSRPLGGVLLGRYANLRGRKQAMILGQGMSLGAEVSNASAYLGKIAPPECRGRYSSFNYMSTGTSVLISSPGHPLRCHSSLGTPVRCR